MTFSIHMPISSDIPSEYYFETNYQAQGKITNRYSARTRNINLSFKEEQLLKKTLDDLTPKDKNGRRIPFARLSDDQCRDILEKVISRGSEKCRTTLNQAGFEIVSNWSLYSNERAKNKLCALTEFLDNHTTITFSQFSTQELKGIYSALKLQKNEINVATTQGQDFTANVKLDDLDKLENEKLDDLNELDDDVLTIKQTFSFGISNISIQYNGCTPHVRDNCTLPELMNTLDHMLALRKEERYKSNPPIRKLKYEEVGPAVDTFCNNMRGWGGVIEPKGADRQKYIDESDWQTPKRTQQERWNEKVADSQSILNSVSLHDAQEEYYVYEVNNIPVGMMVLDDFSQRDFIHIEVLVAHPGSEKCGGSLIEQAVNRSVAVGKNGCVSLESLEDAQAAYLAMGFEIFSGYDMTLEPTKSDKWCQDDQGQWKLKSNFNKKYLWAALNSESIPAKMLNHH